MILLKNLDLYIYHVNSNPKVGKRLTPYKAIHGGDGDTRRNVITMSRM